MCFAGAVPDHSLGVPLGVGEWSGTAQADPRRGSSQAGRTTGHCREPYSCHTLHVEAVRPVREHCAAVSSAIACSAVGRSRQVVVWVAIHLGAAQFTKDRSTMLVQLEPTGTAQLRAANTVGKVRGRGRVSTTAYEDGCMRRRQMGTRCAPA